MHFVAIPENPVPDGAVVGKITTKDGVALRAAYWDARPPVRGTVAILPGRAEFIERYFETIAELSARGFAVAALDWRGQGLSERQLRNRRKGHVDDFEIYERDLIALRKEILEPRCPRPWFALGHGMAGSILIAQARAGRSPFARLVLTAPMIDIDRLHFKTGTRLLLEGLDIIGLGGSYLPGGGRPAYLKPFAQTNLTSDPTRFERTAAVLRSAPELAVGDPTIGWTNAAFRLMRQFEDPEYPRRTLTPMLVIAAGIDRLVSTPAIEAFASRLKAARFITIPYARHDILMERDVFRAQFWGAFDAFIPGVKDDVAKALLGSSAQRKRRGLWSWTRASRESTQL